MNIFVFPAVVVIALILCWLTISGRIAEWNYRAWAGSRFAWLFGIVADLPSLKRLHRWLGFIILAVVLFVYVASLYHWKSQ